MNCSLIESLVKLWTLDTIDSRLCSIDCPLNIRTVYTKGEGCKMEFKDFQSKTNEVAHPKHLISVACYKPSNVCRLHWHTWLFIVSRFVMFDNGQFALYVNLSSHRKSPEKSFILLLLFLFKWWICFDLFLFYILKWFYNVNVRCFSCFRCCCE